MRLIGVLLLFAVSMASANSAVVTDDSLGGIKVGMSMSRALEILNDYEVTGQEISETCLFLRQKGNKNNVEYMVLNNVVVTINVYGRNLDIKTDRGIGWGSTSEEVIAKYPGIKYDKNTAEDGDWVYKFENGNGLLFHVYKDIVSGFRLGSYPGVGFYEGCL